MRGKAGFTQGTAQTAQAMSRGAFVTFALVVMAVVALLACAFTPARSAYAATEMLDANQTGSISVTLHSSDGKVAGGEISLYHVASAVADDTGWHFTWDGAYASMGDDLSSKSGALTASYASSLAERLAPQVQGRTADQTARTDANGTVTFSDLKVGMYLVVETAADAGYDAVDPFVVTVPVEDATTGELIYNVDASPKAGTAQATTTPTTPTSTTSTRTAVPKTGDNTWTPVVPLVLAGIALVAAGAIFAGRERSARRR